MCQDIYADKLKNDHADTSHARQKLRVHLLKKRRDVLEEVVKLRSTVFVNVHELKASYLATAFKTWSVTARLAKVSRVLKANAKLGRDVRKKVLQAELAEAWDKRKLHAAWRIARMLANTNPKGIKNRSVPASKIYQPSRSEWIQHNSLSGQQGGNAADFIEFDQISSIRTPSVLPDMNDRTRASKYTALIVRRLKAMPRRKAIPFNDIPTELWQLALAHPAAAPPTAAIGVRPIPRSFVFYQFVVVFIAHLLATGNTPWQFKHSTAWLLPKDSASLGCAAWRLIHGIHSLSKAFFRVLWNEQPQPLLFDFQLGGVPKRSRMEPILGVMLLTFRANLAGKLIMTDFHDVRSAIQSLKISRIV